MTTFPTIAQVAHDLYYSAKHLTRRDGPTEVRLQVYENGSWAIRVGLSDFDLDHRGFWGAGSISPSDTKEMLKAVAADLIKQVEEQVEEQAQAQVTRYTFAQAIETKYLPATNSRGARVKVTGLGQKRIYPLDYTTNDIHTWAFERFVADLEIKVAQCLHSETKRGNIFLITKA